MERRSRSVGLWLPLSSPTNPTPPLLNCPNPFPATCSERRLSPLFERTYYSTGRQQHQDNSCCKCDRCTSCEENIRDQQENLRGIVQVLVLNKTKKDKEKQKQEKAQWQKGFNQVVVLNEVKTMAKTNKNTMSKRHQTGASQQDEGALQEGGSIPYNCHFFYTDTIFGKWNLHRIYTVNCQFSQ